jgi:HlyD family secretion protein
MAEKQSSSWIKWTIIIFTVVAVITGGVWYFKSGKSAAPDYQTAAVTRGDLTNVVTATGALNPVKNVLVGCQVSGRISKLYVDYNSPVTKDQVIAEIDPSTYQVAVLQATADLANARANLELQQVQARRSSDLFTNNLISGSDYDTVIATLHEAEAMVQIKQASLDNANVNLGYCKILSPVDGVVISRSVDVGQTVASSFNTPTLFQIANDLTKMQIDTSVAEADIGGVQEGQDVTFQVDAYPYRTFYGTVVQVRNAPTNANNVVTYDTVIGVTNTDYRLKPGMTANVSIIIARRENALLIPNAALRFRPSDGAVTQTNTIAAAAQTNLAAGVTNRAGDAGGQRRRPGGGQRGRGGEHQIVRTVYVLPSGAAKAGLRAVPIKIGITDGIETEVLDGLKEGDQIVTSAILTSTQTAAPAANPFGGGGPRRF